MYRESPLPVNVPEGSRSSQFSMPDSNVSNRVISEAGDLTSGQVTLALKRILMSSKFVKSKRLSQFLRFTVEHALQGKAGELKEYTIATEVYGRKDNFDPTLDTIVRSEARRLRRKLKEYYDSEGKADGIIIVFRRGSYIPVHRVRSVCPEISNPSEEEVSVAVEPFECDGSDPLSRKFAFGISDEILHRLSRLAGIRVLCGSVRSCQNGGVPQAAIDSPRSGVVIRGTVRAHDNLLRVIARATTSEGRLLWSHQADSLVGGTTLIQLQERVAIDVLTRIQQWLSARRLESIPETFAA